jgi:hypothetical protein
VLGCSSKQNEIDCGPGSNGKTENLGSAERRNTDGTLVLFLPTLLVAEIAMEAFVAYAASRFDSETSKRSVAENKITALTKCRASAKSPARW